MTIDQIIELIRGILATDTPKTIIAVVAPFLPKPVAALLSWAADHGDCLDELFMRLRGSFGSTGSAELAECEADIVACQQLAA